MLLAILKTDWRTVSRFCEGLKINDRIGNVSCQEEFSGLGLQSLIFTEVYAVIMDTTKT